MATKVIFFDLDDTLYDADPIYEKGVERAFSVYEKFQKSQPTTTPQLNSEEFKSHYYEARTRLKERLKPHGSTSARNRILYIRELLDHLLGRPMPSLALSMEAAYSEAYQEIPTGPAQEVVSKLCLEYELGIITNQVARSQLEKIQVIDPEGRFFKYIITSEECGAEKPSPVIFNYALKRANVAAEDALMVGDNWKHDIEGALSVGIPCIYLNASPPASQRENVTWKRSLVELL